MDFAKYSPEANVESVDQKGWVRYGENNLYPQYLRSLTRKSSVHGALVKRIAKMIAGKGVTNEQLTPIIPHISYDYYEQGTAYVELIWSKDGQSIAEVNHLSTINCRIAADITSNKITGVWYSRDWTNYSNKKGRPVFTPIFTGKPATIDGVVCLGYERSVVILRSNATEAHIYGEPDWINGEDWTQIGIQVGQFHNNNLLNGLFPSFVVNLNNGIPETEEERTQVIGQVQNQIAGAGNAGRALVLFSNSKDQSAEFTPFPTNDNDKLYQFHVDASTEQILIAHGVTTPLLFGIRSASGFGSNKDEMETGREIFMKDVVLPIQRSIAEQLSLAFGEFEFIQNEDAKDVNAEGENVASLALNGAQIQSLVDIINQASAGLLPIQSAKAVVAAGFPNLTPEQIANIFNSISIGAVPKDQIQLGTEKKKPRLSDEQMAEIAKQIDALGEQQNPDWIRIDEEVVDAEEAEFQAYVSTGISRPNATSELDRMIDDRKIIMRFEYSGPVTSVTREFCRKMIAANKLYRKEDIMQMSKIPVNAGWGPRGADTYSVWLYKGGGNCGHVWKRVIFLSAKEAGIDVNSPKARTIAVERAAELGYKPRIQRLVGVKPIDMPNNGFLPKD